MKRLISLILALSMVLTAGFALHSCSGDGGNIAADSGGADDAAPCETTVVTTADSYAALRELDFGGEQITMLVRSEFDYEFIAESENGEVVNDAVYARNLKTEELLNADLEYVAQSGSFSTKAAFMSTYTGSVLANDNAYGLVAAAANYLLALSAEGYFSNLIGNKYITIDSPWYSQGYIDNLTIDGHIYLVAGSASINLLENMCVMFFNRDLLTDLGHDMPYEDVRKGVWTFDKLNALVKDSYSDLDGSGDVSEGDRLGYLTYNNMINAQLFGMGQRYIERGADGVLRFKEALSERDLEVYNKVEGFMNGLDATYHYNDTANNALVATENLVRIWSAGNTLFMPQVLSTAQKLRDCDFDFGVLPMPKNDNHQENYITFILENVTVLGIAPTANLDLAGAALETLSISGYKDLSPVYFEIALKEKYSRDVDTKDMLDIILASVSFEYPMITQFMAQCIQNKKPVVSGFEAQQKSLSANFDKIVEGWLSLD